MSARRCWWIAALLWVPTPVHLGVSVANGTTHPLSAVVGFAIGTLTLFILRALLGWVDGQLDAERTLRMCAEKRLQDATRRRGGPDPIDVAEARGLLGIDRPIVQFEVRFDGDPADLRRELEQIARRDLFERGGR